MKIAVIGAMEEEVTILRSKLETDEPGSHRKL